MTRWQGIRERARWRILRVGRDSRAIFDRIIARYSRVGDAAVFEPSRFPWTALLEAHWEVIRKEAEGVLAYLPHLPTVTEISPDHARISQDGRWKSYFLYGYGIRSDRSCARCPETSRLLERIPQLQTAFFSILSPGAELRSHRGVTKALLTCHLALQVPRQGSDCFIRIGDRTCHWEEGKTLVFDDTNRHEVHNATDEKRVLLLIQFRRPVRFPGALAARFFLGAVKWSPFIRDARRNQREWEDDFNRILRDEPGNPPD